MSSGRHAGQRSRALAPRKAPTTAELVDGPANRHRAPSRNPALSPTAIGVAAIAVAAAAGTLGAAAPGTHPAAGSGHGADPLAALGLPAALTPLRTHTLIDGSIAPESTAASATATRAATTRTAVPTTAAPAVAAAAPRSRPAAAKAPAAKGSTPKAPAPARPAAPATGLIPALGLLPAELDGAVPGAVAAASAALDAVLPGAVLPEAVLPGAVLPEAVLPEAVLPEAVLPKAVLPEAVLPQVPETVPQVAPDSIVPQTVAAAAAAATAAVASVETSVVGGDAIAAAVTAARLRARELLAERAREIDAAAKKAAMAGISDGLASPASCAYSARIQQQPKLDAAQLRNVRAIVDVAKELGLPPRAAVIALATAQQESWLKNLNWGDRDSRGLFQQRPSMGWGTPAQVTDPKHAARSFYRALQDVNGWEHLPVTVAAQRVQRSAFGSRYAQWELMAAKLVAQTLAAPVTALDCTPR